MEGRGNSGKGNAQLTLGGRPISQSRYFWSLRHVHQAFTAIRLAGFVALPGHITRHDRHESALLVADEGRIVLAEVLAAVTRLGQVLRVEQRLGRLVRIEVAVARLVGQLRDVLRRVALAVAVQVVAAAVAIMRLGGGQVVPRLDRLHVVVRIAAGGRRRLGRVLARALQAAGLVPVEGVGADGCRVRGDAAVGDGRVVGW